MMAVIFGLQWVEEVRPDRVVLCSDSAAVLSSLQTMKSNREDLILEIFQCLFRMQRLGIDVTFCWVPAHVGLEGNETADRMAKRALNMSHTMNITFGKGEGKAIIKKKILQLLQKKWDEDSKGRTYYRVQKSVRAHSVKGRSRREEVVLSRVRFDHTGLNKTLFILGKANSQVCAHCNITENAKRVIMHCVKYKEERVLYNKR